MKKIKGKTILAFIAAICFLVVYLVHKGNINLILACAWLCISIGLQMDSSKKDKE